MRLIEKIILLLLSVSLLPLLVTGGLLYLNAQQRIEQQTEANLNNIATIQAHRIDSIRAQNLERLTSFTGRADMKTVLSQYNASKAPGAQAQLNENLGEAKQADSNLTLLTIMTTQGVVVASTNHHLVGTTLSANDMSELGSRQDSVKLVGQGGSQPPVFYLSAPLALDGKTLGIVMIEVNSGELLATIRDYTGLGQTGESILAQRTPAGRVAYITPLRFDNQAAFMRTDNDPQSPMLKTLAGRSIALATARDYRGKTVLLSSRYIANSQWGLIVKIDRAEVTQPGIQLKSEFLMLAFISSVLVVFTAIVLAQRATQPILDIDEVAEQVSQGRLQGRVQDIANDEVGNLAKTFNAMLDNLEQLDTAKNDFVSLASHQLRTPATGVKALIGLLLKDYTKQLTKKQRSYLEQAYGSNERQLRIINDLLNVAMLESGKLRLAKTPVDLNQLVADTVAEQRPIAGSRRQVIRITKPSSPVIVLADAEKIRMVLDNLVSNASKYTPDGGSIIITLRQTGSLATMAIGDTGVGIQPEDIKKLFQKFSQIDNHINHVGGGSAGLGLYLAKSIVELHGGQINVTSKPDKGTTFTVELPLDKA